MNHPYGRMFVGAVIAASACVGGPVSAQERAQSSEQRVAALKKSLAESQAALRTYEWIETTTISLKGEEKSRKQMRCYYVTLNVEMGALPGGTGYTAQTTLDAKATNVKVVIQNSGYRPVGQ